MNPLGTGGIAKTLMVDLAIRYGFEVLGALVILVAGFMIARWLGQLAERRMERAGIDVPIRTLAVRALKLVILLFALVVALDKFGFQIAPLVAGIGVAGIGIGLALQGLLTNLVAGLTIILTKPFRIGEYIEVTGVNGNVASIELFSTTLVHADFSRVIIPNRKIAGEILHNHGSMRQVSLTVGIPHSADLPTALGTVRAVLAANPGVLTDPAPLVGIGEVTDVAIKIRLQPWVRAADAGVVEPRLYEELIEAFRKRGIATPLPRHEVRMIDGAVAR
ncbi:MAG TPA: mechanosensitive ion channel family protein [Candidatus Acidoferrum sp.]|nr:mechanosensitive ion channel family protein [Candidatus Acidoferrum sp.]